MSGNRTKAEAFILKYIEALLPGSDNTEMYKAMFSNMSDKQFSEFMNDLESGEKTLTIIAANMAKQTLDVSRNLKLAEELGHSFFHKLWINNNNDTPTYLTNIKYMVLPLPLRRQAQILEKKISVPEDNRSVDDFTGQPTGKSKGSKISYPETQIMAALNLDQSLIEMLKYRGGDTKGFNAMNESISKTGGVSLDSISSKAGVVKSTQTLSTLLKGMHLDNTL